MKQLIIGAALLAAALPAMAQTGVSVSIGQPGFYGRIDIGDFARPQVVYAQPVIIEERRHYRAEPIYLRVPPGHRKNWKKHCKHYGACGQPVMFVRDEWYNREVVPRYRETRVYAPAPVRYEEPRYEHHGNGHGGGHGNGHGKGHGNGKGHGRGHD
ncbi:hypothetical protein [Massilia sp. AB1]|uniref:hypothetical protein n=1 Tax=Massilia sp. AB1 TaxID=2823371 RepID=UPI001B83E4AE|nr:hypothetical protein [Massilia sp. AB1]MBQ5939802.1 hypothetical protein [Massilia sp. AB1]